MKKLFILLFITVVNIAFIPVLSADNIPVVPDTGKEDLPIVLEPQKSHTDRPKAPGRQVITCYYDGENLNLDFIYSEGECEVYLTELSTNFSRCFTVDSSELSIYIYVGDIHESEITVTTSHGNTYSGVICCNK